MGSWQLGNYSLRLFEYRVDENPTMVHYHDTIVNVYRDIE